MIGFFKPSIGYLPLQTKVWFKCFNEKNDTYEVR